MRLMIVQKDPFILVMISEILIPAQLAAGFLGIPELIVNSVNPPLRFLRFILAICDRMNPHTHETGPRVSLHTWARLRTVLLNLLLRRASLKAKFSSAKNF